MFIGWLSGCFKRKSKTSGRPIEPSQPTQPRPSDVPLNELGGNPVHEMPNNVRERDSTSDSLTSGWYSGSGQPVRSNTPRSNTGNKVEDNGESQTPNPNQLTTPNLSERGQTPNEFSPGWGRIPLGDKRKIEGSPAQTGTTSHSSDGGAKLTKSSGSDQSDGGAVVPKVPPKEENLGSTPDVGSSTKKLSNIDYVLEKQSMELPTIGEDGLD